MSTLWYGTYVKSGESENLENVGAIVSDSFGQRFQVEGVVDSGMGERESATCVSLLAVVIA